MPPSSDWPLVSGRGVSPRPQLYGSFSVNGGGRATENPLSAMAVTPRHTGVVQRYMDINGRTIEPGAILSGVNLSGAILRGAKRYDRKASFPV